MTIKYKKITAFIPSHIHNKKRKHHHKNDWINVYYYVEKKRTQVPPVSEYVITSKIPLKKNTMYKCSALSSKNEIFDYYKILKPGINKKNIAIENRLKTGKSLPAPIYFKKIIKKDEKPFYLHFD